MKILLSILAAIEKSRILKIFGVRAVRRDAFRDCQNLASNQTRENKGTSIWFHAASLGELEMLTPLIEDAITEGYHVNVTAFSDSALSGLKKLAPLCDFCALSPNEKEWQKLFAFYQVKRLILAKYDFWPGLVNAACLQDAEIIVVNAQPSQRSLEIIKIIFALTGSRLPSMRLLQNQVDPRYERVGRRIENALQNPALRNQDWTNLRHPVGIVGSGHLSDLKMLKKSLANYSGTVLFVPHDLQVENLQKLREELSDERLKHVILIARMGVLVELYGLATWAFVGGGYGQGIHSLIEPAAYGIPIASGPARAEEFAEAKELTGLGLVTICPTEHEIAQWFSQLGSLTKKTDFFAEKRALYKELKEKCLND